MVTAAVNPARGTTLSRGTPYGSPVYAAIAQIVSLDGPDRKVGTRETTILTSTSKTFDPTIFDGGELSGQLLYDPKCDSHAVLEGLLTTPSRDKWKIVFNDATNGPTTATFDAILTGFKPTGIEVEANLMADFTLKISGTVAIT